MPPRTDERLDALEAGRILYALSFYRCTWCGVFLVRAGPMFEPEVHGPGCYGRWCEVESPGERSLLLRFLSREMFSRRR